MNHATFDGRHSPAPTAAQILARAKVEAALRGATVQAVVGPRPWAERPLAHMVKRLGMTLAATAFTVATAGAISQTVSTGVALAGMLASAQAKAHVSAHPFSEPVPLSSLLPASPALDALVAAHMPAPARVEPPSPAAAADPLKEVLASLSPTSGESLAPEAIPGVLLEAGQPFLALTARVEAFRDAPYWDSGGLNVGYGYCITQRLNEYGTARVHDDLAGAGFPEETVSTLLEGKRAAQKTLEVSPAQALRLLSITQADYASIARDTLGSEVFDTLPAHRQAALTWLAYNTGADNFPQFKKLAAAVANDAPLVAVQHMTPHYTDNGVSVPNARAGTILMAAYWSDAGMKMAVEKTATLLSDAQRGVSPLQTVDPHLKAARGSALPGSPYLNTQLQTLATAAPVGVQAWRLSRNTMPATSHKPARLR